MRKSDLKSLLAGVLVAVPLCLAFGTATLAWTTRSPGADGMPQSALLGMTAAGLVALSAAAIGLRVERAQVASRLASVDQEAAERAKWLANQAAAEQMSLRNVAPLLPAEVLPASSFSMRAANLEALADILLRHRPRLVVELGSGLSTLLIANRFKTAGNGGRLVAFEHDERWAELCRYYLLANGLDGIAEIRTVPLTRRSALGCEVPWYDLPTAPSDLDRIDLLVVDGPPAGDPRHAAARAPALEVFYPRLSPEARVFLDDTDRTGERAVVDAWVESFPEFHPRFARTLSGYCVLERLAPSARRAVP